MRIVFEEGVCEDIDAELIGGDQYRLLATPLCSSSVAKLGDVVQLTNEGSVWRFERLLHSSPLIILEALVTLEIAQTLEFQAFLDHVREIGGVWEQAFGGVVFIHLPPASVADLTSRMAKVFGQSR
jgi:Domain of unknown function (DUF4265)